MKAHPCRQLPEEYSSAMNEWIDATNAIYSYVPIEPLAPGRASKGVRFEEYRDASARAEAAFEVYKEKMEQYFDCAKRFGPPPRTQNNRDDCSS